VAIDEKNKSADVAPSQPDDDGADEASAPRGSMGLDDLRLRLDSPLFARDAGLAAPAQVPRLRELTWEHVVNPTSSHPVVPSDDEIADGADHEAGAAPKPMRIEDLLSAPADPFSAVSRAMPVDEPSPEIETTTSTVTAAGGLAADDPAPVDDVRPARERPAAPALPSFAAMLSGEVAEVRAPTESSGVDDLVKPIEERPPVARDTDPEVAGLAELILRSTPVTGMPRVEAVRDSLRRDTGTVPTVPAVPTEPDLVADAVAFAPPTTAATPVVPVAPPAPLPPPHSGPTPAVATVKTTTGVQPAVPMSAVEAELNRLAYLPDQEEDLGPVEVPEIVYSDVRSAEPVAAAPVLSNAEFYSPRQSAAPVRHAYTDMVVEKSMPLPRRRSRHVVRKVVTFLVLAGMVAGGLFAVKYFVLDKVKWADDIGPLAAEVENSRKLTFEHDVPVTAMPSSEYAATLANSALGITDENRAGIETQWRALGLLSGRFDPAAVGAVAMLDSPAFYDPGTQSIYVLDGLKVEARTFALHRALTMALLDQQFGWSTRIATEAPAVARGTRALYDADALAVAQSLLDDTERTAVGEQLFALIGDEKIGPSPSLFGSYSAGRLGLALWPYMDAEAPQQRDVIEKDAMYTDAQVLDLRRLVSGRPESAEAQAQGMLFWYHVLAARLDDDLAWNAALGWRSDDLSVKPDASLCVAGTVRIDDAVAAVAISAFNAWAAAAPVESTTTVTVTPGQPGMPTAISVSACDPGESVVTNDGSSRLSLGAAPLRIEQYRRLTDSSAGVTPTVAACAVYGMNDSVSGSDERGVVDPVDGWNTPDNHAQPDPVASGCSPAG
jgi:hypothetical protein